MDLDVLEREAQDNVDDGVSVDFSRGVRTLIARVRAVEAERDRLRAERDEAYPRALQAAADVALRCEPHALADLDSSEAMEWIDNLANDILELSADEIDAFAEQQEQAHRAESGEQ